MEATATEDPPRLIEYMVLCGLKQANLMDYISKLEESAFPSGLSKDALKQNGLVPEILSMYPPTEKKSLPLAANFADYCFPTGCELIEAEHRDETYFFFGYRTVSGVRVHVQCMVQFEKLDNYVEGQKRQVSLQDPEALKEYLLGGASSMQRASIDARPANFAEHPSIIDTRGKFMAKKPPAMPFEVSPKYKEAKSMGNAQLTQKLSLVDRKHKVEEKGSFGKKFKQLVPICLCIVSRVPLYHTFARILNRLNAKASHFLRYPLEVYINYLTSSIPVPPRGFHKISIQAFDSESIEIVPPPPNDLPMCDVSFYPLARSLNPENIVKVLNHIVMERSVLLVSSRIDMLGPVAETLLALIFPFEYQLIYIPVLPHKLADLLQTSCPFLIGMHRSLFDSVGKSINSSVCIVDLDEDKVEYSSKRWVEASMKRSKPVVELAPLPEHERQKLLGRVTKPLLKLRTLGDGEMDKARNEEMEGLVRNIRDGFLLFFVSSLKACGDFWEKKEGELRIDREKLIDGVEEDYKWFLVQFTKTYMFLYWEYSKQHPRNYEQAYDLLFFDESIVAKLNRYVSMMVSKKPTPFLDEKKAFALQSMHVIKMPKPDEALVSKTNVIESYLKSQTLLPIMLTHGAGDTSGYYYRFIAELLPNLFAAVKPEPAANLLTDCEGKLRELRFVPDIENAAPAKTPHIGKEDRMIQLWILVWCRMMPRHEIAEHNYRLEQLLDVLGLYQRKDVNHLVEIHRQIMETCLRFCSARLAIKFYDSINSILVRASPSLLSLFLAAISSGETAQPLHDTKVTASLEDSKSKPMPTMDYQSYFRACMQPFRQRTFLLESTGEVVAEEIKMAHILPKCEKCGLALPDIEPKQLVLEETKSGGTVCEKCGTVLKPKLRVRIGRPLIYAKGNSAPVFWEGEFALLHLDQLTEAISKLGICHPLGLQIIDFATLRREECVFWNVIWCCRLWNLPYDLFLPYKEFSRKSLLLQRRQVREKTASRLTVAPEKENPWFDQFKQIRVMALCTEGEVQTDPITLAELQKLQEKAKEAEVDTNKKAQLMM